MPHSFFDNYLLIIRIDFILFTIIKFYTWEVDRCCYCCYLFRWLPSLKVSEYSLLTCLNAVFRYLSDQQGKNDLIKRSGDDNKNRKRTFLDQQESCTYTKRGFLWI